MTAPSHLPENQGRAARICPTCQRQFPGQQETCPDDGTRVFVIGRGAEERLGEVLDGRYRLSALLGQGGSGLVYRAMDLADDREVAIKLLNPEHSLDPLVGRRFLREARVNAELQHPNIVALHAFGQTAERELYLVMELLKGETLADLLDREVRLPPSRAVRIAAQVCDALRHAHEAGLTHRDVKPENIFRVERSDALDEIKVLDFGLATGGQIAGTHLTRTGMICGTPPYASPEQAQGAETDARSDVYSVGIVTYEMLTGFVPFDAPSPLQILMAHLRDPPPSMRDVCPDAEIPRRLERVVRKALAKRPDDRPQSATELARDLLAAASVGRPRWESETETDLHPLDPSRNRPDDTIDDAVGRLRLITEQPPAGPPRSDTIRTSPLTGSVEAPTPGPSVNLLPRPARRGMSSNPELPSLSRLLFESETVRVEPVAPQNLSDTAEDVPAPVLDEGPTAPLNVGVIRRRGRRRRMALVLVLIGLVGLIAGVLARWGADAAEPNVTSESTTELNSEALDAPSVDDSPVDGAVSPAQPTVQAPESARPPAAVGTPRAAVAPIPSHQARRPPMDRAFVGSRSVSDVVVRSPRRGPATAVRPTMVTIMSSPTRAGVYRGDVRLGETPFPVETESSPYTLTVRRRGYRSKSVSVDGKTPLVSVSLNRRPRARPTGNGGRPFIVE